MNSNLFVIFVNILMIVSVLTATGSMYNHTPDIQMRSTDEDVLIAMSTPGHFTKETHMIPMRDGVRLATDVYLPIDQSQPHGTILIRTPYNKDIMYYAEGFADAGWPTIIQDMRRRFASEGIDTTDAQSEWSDPLPISMPKNKYSIKSMFSQLVERLLEKFPALERLIDRVFDKISNFKAGGTQNTIAFSPLSDSPIYEVDLNYLPSHSFDDLKDMISDLENLGIKTIYILPIMETVFDDPAAAYLIKDHYEINSRYGDSNDLKELVNTAHSYGIRILLDFVTSLAYNGSYITENHPEWILTDDEGEMQKYFPFEDWGWAIDCTNPAVIEYFTGVASYYVEEFDIDGWRVDSPQNNYDWRKVSGDHSRLDLLRSVKSAITNIKPDAILMAEISGPTFIWGENDKNEVPLFDEMCEISYNYEFCGFMGGNFLFGYNYVLPNGSNMEELEETILNKIVHNTATSKEFADFVNNQLILHNRLRANFIENHDTSRVSEAFPKQQKALFVLVATMPGIPVIHAGQENAKIKNSDYYFNVVSCNTGILGLEDFYIKTLKIRSENEALGCGNLIDVWDNGDNTIAFVRHYNDNNAIVGLNFGSKTATSTLNIPIEELDIDPNEKYILFDEFKDVMIGEFIGVDLEDIDIEIDPYGYRIITINVEE